MKVHVYFFAQLRDVTGVSELDLGVQPDATVAELLADIYQLKPALRAHDRTLLIGSGVDFVERDHALTDGEEIAIMPPVQGG
jgi:molybdopterin converting factor small subunit